MISLLDFTNNSVLINSVHSLSCIPGFFRIGWRFFAGKCHFSQRTFYISTNLWPNLLSKRSMVASHIAYMALHFQDLIYRSST